MLTVLECTAENCNYNKSQCCCKQNIDVKGGSSNKSDDTCCSDFVGKREGTATNSCSCCSPSRSIEIGCDVTTCAYNDEKKCFADHVGITGMRASTSMETQCSTFKPR